MTKIASPLPHPKVGASGFWSRRADRAAILPAPPRPPPPPPPTLKTKQMGKFAAQTWSSIGPRFPAHYHYYLLLLLLLPTTTTTTTTTTTSRRCLAGVSKLAIASYPGDELRPGGVDSPCDIPTFRRIAEDVSTVFADPKPLNP